MIPPKPLGPRLLKGRFVALEPLAPEHHSDLIGIADSDPSLFAYMPLDLAAGFAARMAFIAEQNAKGLWMSFAVRRLADGAIVGSTSYMAIASSDARVEIGATWYAVEAQGSAVNPECKLLLLENAFGAGYNRVELKTDARNTRSRAAIRKLGAVEEGTLRAHMWMPQGYFRDTVYFSILAPEWPQVRERLLARLGALS